ncbi:hypothetical protein HSX37_03590|uniref:Uncharacterized protein n=1 Tax=Dendrosporobacter quercicolus TaxID=146817 RepID=A0A1G9MVH4_9FIRM|nr:hypothetical protein [Dendrosporobacter quercicolus]NSL47137.1 hypothetical protein [Dendrosporobacter quercicolus DSM 1736]SDL77635.1 hypothetical protein SAMN04488502_101798 [Dendrosporobacter quercicolus]
MSDTDITKLSRGVFLLVLLIMIGVTVAETQLNRLTHRQEFAQAFAVKRDNNGQYAAYLFGNSVKARAVYPVAQVTGDQQIIVNVAGGKLVMPTRVRIDTQAILAKLAAWYQRMIQQAAEGKRLLQQYMAAFCGDLVQYLNQYR